MDALVVDIKEYTENGIPVYNIRIDKQLHTYSRFNIDNTLFIASNGFLLRSMDRIEVREANPPNKKGWHDNALFVRGSGYEDTRWYTVYSQSYIEQLKVAVKEYNDFIHYEYVKRMWRF